MKPLELHIYDKHPDADAYRVGGFYSPYCLVSRDKRFSEAELAAEFWRSREDTAHILEGNTWKAMCDGWPASEDDALDREYVLDCFASRTHASDADYE